MNYVTEAARLYHIMYPRNNFYNLPSDRQAFYVESIKEYLKR